ncbi:MAG: hypothetical protein GY820_11810 [Gammaproteobacteria bacterium]|nr:hypothetical protein [Gammaproteobacteria bacterium]
MSSNDDIPVLTDLIKDDKIDITLTELGLDLGQDMHIEPDKPDPEVTAIDSKLEQTIRRILDEHMELAWQEIRLAIQLSQDDDI